MIPKIFPSCKKQPQANFIIYYATLGGCWCERLNLNSLLCRACYPTTEEEVEAFLCMVLMQKPHGRHAQGTADGLVSSDSAGKGFLI